MLSRLSFFARRQSKLTLTLFVGLLTVSLYAASGELASASTPRLFPLTSWDLAIPLLPWTFWIYSSVYFIYFSSCALQKDEEVFHHFLIVYVWAYASTALLFVLLPTTFPRELFPLPEQDGSLTLRAFAAFRQLDHPTNCLPSMHVASTVMSTAPFWKRRPRVFWALSLWALAISVTTLTTKQHYLIDVLGGLVYGLASYLGVTWFLRHRQRQRSPQPEALSLS